LRKKAVPRKTATSRKAKPRVTPVPARAAVSRSFSEQLREAAEPFWTKATTHRLTDELADDRLPTDVFRRYLVEDYAFLDTLATLVAAAVMHAPTLGEKRVFASFLASVTGEENTYFQRSFAALGVPESDWAAKTPARTTEQLRRHMETAAQSGRYEDILAVLVATEWSYLAWAERVAERLDREGRALPERFYYREWIALHTVAAFRHFVEWLRGEFDRAAERLPAARRKALGALFRRAMELEVAFFDAAYGTDLFHFKADSATRRKRG
jgi:thiaminase/transcriptional activator TenA